MVRRRRARPLETALAVREEFRSSCVQSARARSLGARRSTWHRSAGSSEGSVPQSVPSGVPRRGSRRTARRSGGAGARARAPPSGSRRVASRARSGEAAGPERGASRRASSRRSRTASGPGCRRVPRCSSRSTSPPGLPDLAGPAPSRMLAESLAAADGRFGLELLAHSLYPDPPAPDRARARPRGALARHDGPVRAPGAEPELAVAAGREGVRRPLRGAAAAHRARALRGAPLSVRVARGAGLGRKMAPDDVRARARVGWRSTRAHDVSRPVTRARAPRCARGTPGRGRRPSCRRRP